MYLADPLPRCSWMPGGVVGIWRGLTPTLVAAVRDPPAP
jgi:hypothetical protein